jgi:hypothetical protein
MKNSELSFKDYQVFMLKSLAWLGLAWVSFVFALGGFFYASLIWTIFGVAVIWFAKKAISIGLPLKISRELLFVSLAFFLVVLSLSFFSEPSVFTGRDQGSFSEAAARLAQNHQLEFSTPASDAFFKLHEPGRALNFPGFYYTKSGALITQFSLVYISWLALFFATFGTTGFIIANSILLYTFFLSFYLLLRLFIKTSSAAPAMLLTATSFVFMWFSKFTLSENMALPLVWLTILSLMLFLKSLRKLHYFVFLAAAFLLCFTRIEGIAFLVSSIVIIALNKEARAFIQKKTAIRFFLPAFILLGTFAINIYIDAYFYKEIIKALLPSLSLPQAKYLGEIKNNVLPSFYTGKVFYLYGLFGFFTISTISVIFKLWKNEFYRLVPFFVTLPTFVYFFDSQITPDHPWMLRRFMISLFPVAIFYTGLFLGRLFETNKNASKAKALATLLTLTLLVMNLPAFLRYVTFAENKDLFKQTQTLSAKFSATDLILIDREASGDGWSMLGGPMSYLAGKNAVYFFNNHDLATLDTSAFSNVYLIAPEKQVPFYLNSTIGNKLTQTADYTFKTARLNAKQNSTFAEISLPEKKSVIVSGKIFKVAR